MNVSQSLQIAAKGPSFAPGAFEPLHLGLDLGTRSGFALGSLSGLVHCSGVWNLTPKKGEDPGLRFMRFRERLALLLERHAERLRPGAVWFEYVRAHEGVQAAHVYGGLRAILLAECSRLGLSAHGLPVATIKKHATGAGNAHKPAMIRAARERFGLEPLDDNHADALHVLRLGLDVSAGLVILARP